MVRFSAGSSRTGEKRMIAQNSFADLKHGGQHKALRAAMAWRDETAIRLNKIERPHSQHRKYRTQANSKTGVVGVYHIETVDKHGVYRNQYRVEWRETDTTGRRRPAVKIFTIGASNKEAVFRQAVRWRKKMEKLHYVGPYKKKRSGGRVAK